MYYVCKLVGIGLCYGIVLTNSNQPINPMPSVFSHSVSYIHL